VPDQKAPRVRDHSLDLRTLGSRNNLQPQHLSRDNNRNNLNNSRLRINLDLVKGHPRIQLLLLQAHRLRWAQMPLPV